MKTASLCKICSPKQWKTISSDMLTSSGYPVYGANGVIGYYSKFNHENETLLITCRGATCGTLNICSPFSYVNGNAMALDNLDSDIDIKYLYYYLLHRGFSDIVTGSAQPQIVRQSLEKVVISYPDLKTQKAITSRLDRISNLITLRKQQLEKLDELVKALFVEIFGDMLLNPLDWPELSLETMSDIVSGITKGRKTKELTLTEVPYMAVSNVKDGYIDWTTVKTIPATDSEIEQYRLQPNDILMTEGGDPDKLGRGAIIREPPDNCIHQNHIFRVRLNQEIILPEFFSEYLQQPKAKLYFLRCAKQTTGIASINMKQLRLLPVLLPPIKKQNLFVSFVENLHKSKLTIQQGLAKMKMMKKALMQGYFEKNKEGDA